MLDVEAELGEDLAQLRAHVVVLDENRAHHSGLDDATLGQVAVARQEHAVLGRGLTHELGVADARVIRGVVAERPQPPRQAADVAVGEEPRVHAGNLRIGRVTSRPNLYDELLKKLRGEAGGCYSWSNGAGDRYAAHSHDFEKVLYCVAGSITFMLESEGRNLELKAGDRMVLPAGTVHSAVVGDAGCTCIEGRR